METCSCGARMVVVSVPAKVRPGVVIPSEARVRMCRGCDGPGIRIAEQNGRSVIKA